MATTAGSVRARVRRREAERSLLEDQASLRRVATLVARACEPAEIFQLVAAEVGELLSASVTHIVRYEADRTITVLAGWSPAGGHVPVGGGLRLDGPSVEALVLETGVSSRIDDYGLVAGAVAAAVRDVGICCEVAAPIAVEGRLWGAMIIARSFPEPFPAGTEARLESFTELAAIAIGDAEARAELAASRARLVAASDDVRRRIERNLHDGTQQRLVSLGLDLATARRSPPEDMDAALALIQDGMDEVVEEIRQISRGLHPAILSDAGLRPALNALARRSAIPVQIRVDVDERLPSVVETTAYYTVCEALANVAKHAQATGALVTAAIGDGVLDVAVSDDGIGGADARGSGLVGLADRVSAVGGRLEIESPPGAGTVVRVELPLQPVA